LHKKGKKRDEGDVLAALNSFRGKLQDTMFVDEPEDGADGRTAPADPAGDAGGSGAGGGGQDEEGMEVDDDTGFMAHSLHFPKDDIEETKAERDYEVIDPRARGAKAREEERDRKKAAQKARGGGVINGRYRRQ